ncbi:hypothetical protein IMCC1989_2615 [gamma proteobacterium IMCC1989]|nr:hypothetical protein IMCC1989_2615 [gamma proteobacterium IMCC1989]
MIICKTASTTTLILLTTPTFIAYYAVTLGIHYSIPIITLINNTQ